MNDLITFRLGDSRFAIPAAAVAEIVESGPIEHRLPGDDGARVGLARVRDRWIPVVELAGAVSGAPSLDPDAGDALLLVLGRERGRRIGKGGDFRCFWKRPSRCRQGGGHGDIPSRCAPAFGDPSRA